MAFLISIPLYVEGQGGEPKIEAMADSVRSVPISELSREHLPGGGAEEVIEKLREHGEVQRLIKLRDKQAMDEAVEHFVEIEAKSLFVPRWITQTHSPHFIKHLGPLLYLDDSIERRRVPPGDFDQGFTLAIAQGIGGIIVSSPEFTDEVKEWIRSGRYRSSPDPIGRLRQWWGENEEHFENEDYHLVRPVSWDLENADKEPEEPRDRDGDSDGDVREKEGASIDADDQRAAYRPGGAPEREESPTGGWNVPPWIWMLAVIALVGAWALGFLRFRAGRRG